MPAKQLSESILVNYLPESTQYRPADPSPPPTHHLPAFRPRPPPPNHASTPRATTPRTQPETPTPVTPYGRRCGTGGGRGEKLVESEADAASMLGLAWIWGTGYFSGGGGGGSVVVKSAVLFGGGKGNAALRS